MRLINGAIEEVGRCIRREVASMRPRVFHALACHHLLAGTMWLGVAGIAAIIIGFAIVVARRVSLESAVLVGGALAVLTSGCGYALMIRRVSTRE